VEAFGRVATDFEAEGLLDGLEDEAREARLELLEHLQADGIPLEELKQAAAEGRLALIPVERVLEGEGPRYDIGEVADKSGLDREFFEEVLRAMGIARPEPDEKRFTDADIDAARRIREAREAGIPDDDQLEITRAMSSSLRNVATAVTRVFGRSFLRPGDTEKDLALRYAESSKALAPVISDAIGHVFQMHLREEVRQAAVSQAEIAAGSLPASQDMAVGFADLVGFTRLGERIEPDELGTIAGRLASLATEVAEPPVRLVKTIGDAAMLVAPDPDALLEVALTLVDAAEGEELPPIHAGVAHGPVLGRGGDWYGRPVNLASRITGFARPESVVASEDVKEATGGDWAWSFAGKRKFKGIKGEEAVFRVRRAELTDD
jgi:adenylate cyclase